MSVRFVSLLAMLAACAPEKLRADVVELSSGGQVHGEVIRDPELPRSIMAIDSPWGRIELERSQVEKLTPEKPAHAEYRRRAPTVSDTAESQYALAMWCRDNGLADEIRIHLGRVVTLDPNHEPARQLLGYQRVGDRWLTREQRLAARGLVRIKGEFRTPQEVELIERNERVEQIEIEWKQRLSGWRRDLDSRNPEEARLAKDELVQLTAPAASGPLVELLNNEQNRNVKQLLLRTAGQIPTPATRHALVLTAINDPDAELRATALEQLERDGRPGLVQPFLTALGSKNNVTVNRAADGIARLGSTAAIEPLIEALITTHRQRVRPDSGGDTYSLNTGTGEYAFGSGGPSVESRERRNPRVLQALVELSGENYAYDQPSWRNWLASRQVAIQIDLRRDP